MTATEKDLTQDEQILRNTERIARNEEAIKRQTNALEQIRDHFYPPRPGILKITGGYAAKMLLGVLAYAGGVQAVDWFMNVRKAQSMAEECASVAKRLFFEDGNAEGAARFYEKAIELDGDEVEYTIQLKFMRGMALAQQLMDSGRKLCGEDLERVDAMFADAVFLCETEPESPMSHVLMAQAFVLKGEKDAAVAEVERAVGLEPLNASVRTSSCAIYFMSGRIGEAHAAIRKAEEINAELPLVISWKGMLALTDGDVSAARKCFEEFVRRSPRLAIAHTALGQSLLVGENCDWKRARECFEKALLIDPRQRRAMIGMAESYARENVPLVARLWLDRAIAEDANCVDAFVARAKVNEKIGDHKAAAGDMTSAIALVPFRPDLYRLRSDILAKIGDTAQANSDRATADALSKVKK